MVALAIWLWITLVVVSVMRRLVPQDTSLPSWMHSAARVLIALFLGSAGTLLAARLALPPHLQAAFAIGGIATGLLVFSLWRRTIRRYEQRRS
jgi:hypothetical protein